MDDPVRVISTVQVGITALGILTGAIGESLVRELLGDWIPAWLSFLLSFAIITYLSVVFGELAHKAFVLARAETLDRVCPSLLCQGWRACGCVVVDHDAGFADDRWAVAEQCR